MRKEQGLPGQSFKLARSNFFKNEIWENSPKSIRGKAWGFSDNQRAIFSLCLKQNAISFWLRYAQMFSSIKMQFKFVEKQSNLRKKRSEWKSELVWWYIENLKTWKHIGKMLQNVLTALKLWYFLKNFVVFWHIDACHITINDNVVPSLKVTDK